ncbi:MAG: hypothetical protein HND43_06450 [Armatimonadetes bacterium]|nr:hypothetical protein [Armatimonadota bacterium]NOG39021.1 hypothetical protein [Armatimonadota bacterium]GIK33032.1 MAG: hypothetical protein BroJett009_20240 [Armatimonadota bacterium]
MAENRKWGVHAWAALLALGGSWSVALGQSGVVEVEVGIERSPERIASRGVAAVRDLAQKLARSTESARGALSRAGRYHPEIPLSFPTVVRFRSLGSPLQTFASQVRPPRSMGPEADLNLVFDSSGPRVFPTQYKQLLIDTFNQAKSTLNTVFGQPSIGGDVYVRNFDADIGDRHAVTGGYFVPDNGAGEAEIRFPVYSSQEAASVNFVHCLLLAYLGPNSYAYDAFQEGLVRAAAMRVVRTAGALPVYLDSEVLGFVLENTYDVGPHYDGFNQRPLGGPSFIAPNLVSAPLPAGGSLGGIYLARYQMAGSAWQKVLAEYPGFLSAFNPAFFADPSIGGDRSALAALAQSVIDSLAGSSGATVEGRSFAEWMRRQSILDTSLTLGPKLFVQNIPLPPDAGTSDFGVVLVQCTYFETRPNGDEVLLSGVSYPIFWTDTFERIFPSAQEDRMDIAGAYGSVAPNLPDLRLTSPYRAAVDIGVQDRINRTYVAVGAVATGQQPTPNDFWGTIVGITPPQGATLRVRLTYGATVVDNIPVTFGAFKARINTPEFLGYQRLRVEVIQTNGPQQDVLIDRRISKGPGSIELDLRPNDGEVSVFSGGLPRGLFTLGIAADPLTSLAGEALGIPEAEVLAARYNSSKARYDIYPDSGPLTIGQGYFLRLENAQPGFAWQGRTSPATPLAVALRPGWNLIGNPLGEAVSTSRVTVVHAANFPMSYGEALGTVLGVDFFEFVPGAPDAASGAPETGTMAAASNFGLGKAYFVRVLAPEGAVLLFRPAPVSMPQGPFNAASPFPPSIDPLQWTLRLNVIGSQERCEVFVGQSRTATLGFDRAEDSGLPPPLSGGLQAASITRAEALFRDVRRSGATAWHEIRLSGLRPGQRYTVRAEVAQGSLRQFVFRDPEAFFHRTVRPAFEYSFTATLPDRTLWVGVGNVR